MKVRHIVGVVALLCSVGVCAWVNAACSKGCKEVNMWCDSSGGAGRCKGYSESGGGPNTMARNLYAQSGLQSGNPIDDGNVKINSRTGDPATCTLTCASNQLPQEVTGCSLTEFNEITRQKCGK